MRGLTSVIPIYLPVQNHGWGARASGSLVIFGSSE
jgi:hypothetical protein